MEFLILGPLEVRNGDEPVRLGAAKQRALLGVLLLHANETVSTSRLVEELWGESPPATAESLVQGYVHALRKQLGAGVVETRPPGYRLDAGPGSLDLLEFERLVREARAAEPGEAAELRRRALALWRGPPLADVVLEGTDRHTLARLAELRLSTQVDRIEAELAAGRHADVVGELEALVAEHPYQERAAALLMLALYRSGRQADALEAYRTVRRKLSDELGLEPGKELRDLEAAILRHDEALSPVLPVPAAAPEQQSTAGRMSRRAVIVAGAGGVAVVALGVGVTAFHSRPSHGTPIRAGSVGVIDPVAREVVAEIPVGFGSPLIAAGADAVWLVDRDGMTLTRIDPKTRAHDAPTAIPARGVPTAVAAGAGSVWIALNEERALSVLQLEPEFLDRRGRVVLDRRDEVIPVSVASVVLTVGEGAVWALERGLGRVNRIDPATSKRTVMPESVGGSSIAVDRAAVWIGGPSRVTKLDPRTGRELASTFVAEEVLESTTTSVAVGRDALWFVGDSSTRLWRIPPHGLSVEDFFELGATPSGVTVREEDGAVWVAGRSSTTVWRLDPATDDLEEIEAGPTSGGLVARFGMVWTSPGGSVE